MPKLSFDRSVCGSRVHCQDCRAAGISSCNALLATCEVASIRVGCGCLFVHVSCTHAADANGINNSSMFEDRIEGTVVNKDVSRISVALTVTIQNCGLMHKTDSKKAPVPM